MRLYILIFIFLGLSCSHNFKITQREPNQLTNQRMPIHLIVTVHGIGGSSKSFGYMSEALLKHMKDVQPQYNFQAINFNYQTGDKKLSTYDFAKSLSMTIDDFFIKNGGLIEEDKISLITHSQGGLISIIWYLDNLLKNTVTDDLVFSDSPLTKYVRHVDGFVSLAAPFWGSKLAAGSQSDYSLIRWLGKQLPLGFTELKEMSFSSNTIFKFRRRALSIDKKTDSDQFIKARFLNIAGIVADKISEHTAAKIDSNLKKFWMQTSTNFLNSIGFGGERYESDTAVIIPSARLDFIHGEALDTDYKSDEVLEFKDFQQTKYLQNTDVPFLLVRAVHASPNINDFYDVVEIPKICLEPKLCDHPTYKFVVEHLLNCENQPSQCDQNKYKTLVTELDIGNSKTFQTSENNIKPLQGFTLDINLRLPLDYKLNKKLQKDDIGYLQALEINYETEPFNFFNPVGLVFANQGRITRDVENIPYDIYLGRGNELYSATTTSAYTTDKKHMELFDFYDQKLNPLRFNITGIVKPRKPNPQNTGDYEKWKENGFPVKFRINLPGLKPRIVIARVRPTYSTFIDVVLERETEK